MSAMHPSALAGYDAAKFTGFFPRADANPDTIQGWITNWFAIEDYYPLQSAVR
jgi:hypothetical protein